MVRRLLAMGRTQGCVAGLCVLLTAGMAQADPARDAADAWVRGDIAAAQALWQDLATTGNPRAQFNLGIIADSAPQGVTRDAALAYRHYVDAAEGGFAPAYYNLGVMLLAGDDGVPANRAEAIDWLRAAANTGDILAMVRLGEDLTADASADGALGADEGAAWYLRAAEADFAPAQSAVSMLYARGRGLPRDLGAAASWAERAELTTMVTGDVGYCIPSSAPLLAKCRRITPLYD